MEIEVRVGEDTEDLIEIDRQIHHLLEIAEMSNVHIKQRLWQSKINRYVQYDYEPFLSGGFFQKFMMEGTDENMEFFKYLFTKHANDMMFLESCYNLDAVAR